MIAIVRSQSGYVEFQTTTFQVFLETTEIQNLICDPIPNKRIKQVKNTQTKIYKYIYTVELL